MTMNCLHYLTFVDVLEMFKLLPTSALCVLTCLESLSQGFIKINIDGSYSLNLAFVGIGGVFRDHDGKTLLHFGKQL